MIKAINTNNVRFFKEVTFIGVFLKSTPIEAGHRLGFVPELVLSIVPLVLAIKTKLLG